MKEMKVDYELLLIDDGSTDASGEVCEILSARDGRIQVWHQPNKGVSAARNKGVSLAKGHYLCFIDGDDWIDENYLAALYQPCIQNEKQVDVSIIIYQYEYTDGHSRQIFHWQPAGLLPKGNILKQMLEVRYWDWVLHGKLYATALLREYPCHEGISIAEDLADNWVFLSAAQGVYYQPLALYHYRVRENSVTHWLHLDKWLEAMRVWLSLDILDKKKPDAQLRKVLSWQILDAWQDVTRRIPFATDQEEQVVKTMYSRSLQQRLAQAVSYMEQGQLCTWLRERFLCDYAAMQLDYQSLYARVRQAAEAGSLYLYGAGVVGEVAQVILETKEIKPAAYVVTSLTPGERRYLHGLPILALDEVQNQAQSVLLICAKTRNLEEMTNIALARNFQMCLLW